MGRGRFTVGAELMFLALTMLTQIGGLVYMAASTLVGVIGRRTGVGPMKRLLGLVASFSVMYVTISVGLCCRR